MPQDCKALVESYIAWLRDRITVADVNGVCEITTPFLDRHNDCLQIYVERRGNKLHLTDDGYVIGDLEDCGVTFQTLQRQNFLKQILNGYGIQETEGELFVEANERTFPQRKHSLLQAMMAVNDMFLTAKPRVAQFFLEDVSHFLDDHEIRYSPSIQFTGKTGFPHKYDFLIPKSSSANERIIRAINNPTRANASYLIFSWTDTRESRPLESRVFAFLNDSESEVSSEIVSALESYDVTPMLWSERNDFLPKLAA